MATELCIDLDLLKNLYTEQRKHMLAESSISEVTFFQEICMNLLSDKNKENLGPFGPHRVGPGRVGAQSGLGPGPGWGPYGPIWVLLDRSWQVRTYPISDCWSNFACFGFKI